MRDLLVVAVVFGSLPVVVFRPFWGLVVFTWLAYMRPTNLGWGLASSMSLSQYVALATIIGLVIAVLQRRERFMVRSPQTILMILLALWAGMSVFTAVDRPVAWESYAQFAKIILIALLTTGLVNSEKRFRIMILVTAFSLGLLGMKYGIFGAVRGGARFDSGPGGFMQDNNQFALALDMILPLLVGIAIVERSRVWRLSALTLAFFSAMTVIFTFSRGGFLAMGVVAFAIALRSGRRRVAVGMLALFAVGYLLLPTEGLEEEYAERLQTIVEYREDASAMGRLNAWKVALDIFEDHPMLGVGPDNFMVVYEWYGDPEAKKVAHNAFLQLLSECGLPALLLLLGILGSTWIRLEHLRSQDANEEWIRVYSAALQISLLAFVVGASFLDRAFFDLIYHLVALSVCLETCARSVERAGDSGIVIERTKPEAEWWRQPSAARWSS